VGEESDVKKLEWHVEQVGWIGPLELGSVVVAWEELIWQW